MNKASKVKPVNYYYYPPLRPQFFFPRKEFKTYQKYYSPYSLKSKLFWFLYRKCKFIRLFFKVSEADIPLPILEIKDKINLKNATYFYNLGTQGCEQTATIIAKNFEHARFLKFAQEPHAKELVENEAEILSTLKNQENLKVAKVFDFVKNDEFCFVLTELILGEKASFTKLNNDVFNILLILAKIKSSKLFEVFSHGDFCPWNMLVTKEDKIVLIDWEMAGFKPLGYDLFTFIFHTNFLLNSNKKIKIIIDENRNYINSYFNDFNIQDWKPYLLGYAKTRISLENRKKDSLLLLRYQKLYNYNEYD